MSLPLELEGAVHTALEGGHLETRTLEITSEGSKSTSLEVEQVVVESGDVQSVRFHTGYDSRIGQRVNQNPASIIGNTPAYRKERTPCPTWDS